jgi:hypothetical protein
MYLPVNDRLRKHGVSKSTNLNRALIGIFDLIGMMWLQSRFKGRNEQSVEVALDRSAEQSRQKVG